MDTLLTQLKLARIREVVGEWLERAAAEEMSYADFLKGLLSEEVCARKENQLQRRRHQANFPFEKTIEQFDFSLRPGLKRQSLPPGNWGSFSICWTSALSTKHAHSSCSDQVALGKRISRWPWPCG